MNSGLTAPPLQLRIVTALFWMLGLGGPLWLLLIVIAASFGWVDGAPPPVAALLGVVLALPVVATAWGLHRGRMWSRWTAIAIAMLAVPFFPTGTVLGLFSLGTLLSRGATQFFGGEFF